MESFKRWEVAFWDQRVIEIDTFSTFFLFYIGIAILIIGIVNLLIGIIAMLTAHKFWGSYTAGGIWSGLFIIMSGFLITTSGYYRINKYLKIETLVICIITQVLACISEMTNLIAFGYSLSIFFRFHFIQAGSCRYTASDWFIPCVQIRVIVRLNI